MRRGVAAAFVGALVLTSMLVSAEAQAGPADGQFATKCSYTATLKFKPPLHQGENDFAFIKLDFKLKNCAGATVSWGKGPGGSEDTLYCDSGQVTSAQVGSKLGITWDTGERTALNFFFAFDPGQNSIRGEVVSGLFKGDDVRSKHFAMEPLKGDCAETPLIRSMITGTITL